MVDYKHANERRGGGAAALTVPRDPIIELDPDGVQVVDDLGPLVGSFSASVVAARRSGRGNDSCSVFP